LAIQRRVSSRSSVLEGSRGDADHALAIVRESLTRIRDLHDKFAFVHAMVPLAAAAALKGDHAWTARVLGASDVVTERTGVKVLDHAVRDLRSDTERAARVGLGTERWADAYAAGAFGLDRRVAAGHRRPRRDSSRGIAGRAQRLYDVRVTAREVP
jgi:hypothetical protein